jgi:hypothetical protein
MGAFNKSLKHFRTSRLLEEKIKDLDKDLQKTKVVINDNDLNSLYEETVSSSPSVSNWREEFVQRHDVNGELEFEFLKEEVNKNTLKKVSSQRVRQNEEIIKLRDEILKSISEDLVVNLPEVNRKIDRFNYAYSTLVEGLLNDPEGTRNSDPLTPLNQNFVTVDELNNHYKLFIHRIQEQLATLGGGGETKLQYLDDIVGIATNASEYDNKFLRYNDTIKKFEFVSVNSGYSPVAGIATEAQGLTGKPNIEVGICTADHLIANTIEVGISTANYYNGSGSNLTGIVTTIIAGTGITVTSSTGTVVIAATNGAVSGGGTWATTSAGIHTTKNVGVGTTNPVTTLQIERYGVVTGFGTFNASAGVEYQIDSFNISSRDFKTAEYTLHIENGSGIQAQKVLVMQNGTTAYSQEYAVMYEPQLIVSVGATIFSGSCNMNIKPESTISGLTTYRFVRNSLL